MDQDLNLDQTFSPSQLLCGSINILKSQTEIATIVNMLSKITMQNSSSMHELFLSNLHKMQKGMKMNTYWTLWVYVKIF